MGYSMKLNAKLAVGDAIDTNAITKKGAVITIKNEDGSSSSVTVESVANGEFTVNKGGNIVVVPFSSFQDASAESNVDSPTKVLPRPNNDNDGAASALAPMSLLAVVAAAMAFLL